jgi:type IV pilus assembly protein PilO
MSININIDELDIKEIGLWPIQFRIAIVIILCILEIMLSYSFFLKNDFNKILELKVEQKKLLNTFKDYYQQSSNLEAYKQQMVQIQKSLQALLQKLPSKGEIPVLLEDISQQALAFGLKFELIKPEDPIDKEFYVEQPIEMVLVGKYHGFAKFVEGISKLPRIVTLHDFSIAKSKDNYNNVKDLYMQNTLTMKIYAKTYWYNSKDKL